MSKGQKKKRKHAHLEACDDLAVSDPGLYLFNRTGWYVSSDQAKPSTAKFEGLYCFRLGVVTLAAIDIDKKRIIKVIVLCIMLFAAFVIGWVSTGTIKCRCSIFWTKSFLALIFWILNSGANWLNPVHLKISSQHLTHIIIAS